MANSQEVKKDLQSSSKPTLEQLVNKANENKQVSKEELEVILERYTLEQKSINAKTKTDIDILSKEAGMDMIQKGISLKTKKDIQLLQEILSKNGIEIKIDEKTKTKIFDTKGVVAIYDNNDKQILLYGNTGTRLGNINREGGFDEINFSLFRKNNDPKDDDLGLIKDKNAVKVIINKEKIPTASEQETKDAQFGLDVLDKYTKIELNEIYKQSGIDGIKKLAKLHGMMSQNDIRLGLQEFGSKYDNSHIIAAVKILKVFGEDKTKIETYLNGGVIKTNQKQAIPESKWLNPDDIEKHKKHFLDVLKKTKDINELLKKENRVSYDYVFKNLNLKNATGKLIFEEEGKLFGEKLKSYTCEKYKLDVNKLNILIDPSQNPDIKIKLDGKDYGKIVIKDNKFELNKTGVKKDSKEEVKKEGGIYTIKKGDSLWKITKGNQELMKKIKELNTEVKDWNKLSIGQVIKVPTDSKKVDKGNSKKEKKSEKNTKRLNTKEEGKGEKKEEKTKDVNKTDEKPKDEGGKNIEENNQDNIELNNKGQSELAELSPEWSARMNGQKTGLDKNDIIKKQRLNKLIEEVIAKNIITKDELASIINQFTIEKQYIEAKSVKDFNYLFTKISTKMLENGINVDKKDLATINAILNYLGINSLNEGLFQGKERYYVISNGTEKNELAVYSSGENGYRIYNIDTKLGKAISNSKEWNDKNNVTNDSMVMTGKILGDEYKVDYIK